MIDIVENAAQLAVVALCFAVSMARAVRGRDRMWVILSFSYGCTFFSLVYWTCYLVAFGQTPRYSYAPDLGWMASYIFLAILLVEFDAQRSTAAPMRAAWIVPAVCVPTCILYCTHGDILLNVADCALMAAIGYFATRGALAPSSSEVAGNRPLHIAVLAFAVAELVLWTASCFWTPENYLPYVVADYALTASYAVMLACAWKASLE